MVSQNKIFQGCSLLETEFAVLCVAIVPCISQSMQAVREWSCINPRQTSLFRNLWLNTVTRESLRAVNN